MQAENEFQITDFLIEWNNFFSSYFRPSWEPTFIEFFSYIPSLSLLSLHSAPPSSSSPPLPHHSLRVSVHSLCSASFLSIYLTFSLLLFSALQRKGLKQIIRTLPHILSSFFESVSYENRIFPDINHSRSPRCLPTRLSVDKLDIPAKQAT